MLSDIQWLALTVRTEINRKADEILEDQFWAHQSRLQKIQWDEEQRLKQQVVEEALQPYSTIEQWFEHQSEDTQSYWYTRYQDYQYGPNGDATVREDDFFAWEVIGYLYQSDPILKQPFCAWCDSRGHESGACMGRP